MGTVAALILGLLLLAAAGAAFLAFLFFWIPRLMDRRLEHFQSDLMDRHYDEVENMYRTMRGWRHDYHNHIQAMKAYAQLGKYEELIAYLGRLDENLYQVDTVVKTGNLMMDAVLGSKLSLMKHRGIRTDVTVHVPEEMRLTDMELCVLVGNLLDNAIEACDEVAEEENRFIRIYMDTLQEQFYLSIMNGMKGKAQRKGMSFVSRKREGGLPGFGLQRVDRIVEKYGGYLNRQTEDGVFATEILLPLARRASVQEGRRNPSQEGERKE